MGADESVQSAPTISEDHPGVVELFAVLAYGEISAFYRLTDDAKLAPTLEGRTALARMAAAEMGHFESLEEYLLAKGFDAFEAMAPFAKVLESYHDSTAPTTWLESLVKAYVGDGLAADFYLEIADWLDPAVGEVVREVLAETGHSEFVISEVRSELERDPKSLSRLTLWGRRLLGEAITQAQYVLASNDDLADLVITGYGDLNGMVELFGRMQTRHDERMKMLGLA